MLTQHACSKHSSLKHLQNILEPQEFPDIMASRRFPPCLEGELQSFLDLANAVMVLDSGVEWHVHSDILALQSSVLSDAYAAHRQSASANEPCRLTLESCSEAEASKFLDFFYYRDAAVSMKHAEKVLFADGILLQPLLGIILPGIMTTHLMRLLPGLELTESTQHLALRSWQ